MTHKSYSQPDPECWNSKKQITKLFKEINGILEKQGTSIN